ncbi:MAG: GNAT family protein [Dermatophilaceae bacterium]
MGRLDSDVTRPLGPTRRNDLDQEVGTPVCYPGATAPRPLSLQGATCRLEPLGREHAADLLAAVRSVGGDQLWTYLPFAPCRTDAEFADLLDDLSTDGTRTCFAVVPTTSSAAGRRGRAAGMAALQRVDARMGTIEVAFVFFGDGVRRATPGTEAHYLLARHVFDDLGFRRYEWKCDALNADSRRAAARLGFAFEGIWRNAVIVKGRTRDTAWYAMTDGDWAGLKPGYGAWLADADSRGVRPLAVALAQGYRRPVA